MFSFITHGLLKLKFVWNQSGKKNLIIKQVLSDFLLWVQPSYMRTFCSLTWRVREGRFPDTIILGNSGSVVCSILLQGEKTPCKTQRKFESKFNSCSTGQTFKAYKKNLIFNCILPTIKAMLKEKSEPDFKLLLIFPWLQLLLNSLSTLTVNLKISHLYKLSPL